MSFFYFVLFYSGTCPSCLTDLLSLRGVGVVGTRIIVKSSCSQWEPVITGIQTQVLRIASPALFY